MQHYSTTVLEVLRLVVARFRALRNSFVCRPFLRSPPLGAASGRVLQVGRFAASVLSVPPLVRGALSGKNRWDGTED